MKMWRSLVGGLVCCLAEAYQEVAKLTASDAAANDNFGGLVAIDAGTVVVGADTTTTAAQTRARPTSSVRPTAAPRTAR